MTWQQNTKQHKFSLIKYPMVLNFSEFVQISPRIFWSRFSPWSFYPNFCSEFLVWIFSQNFWSRFFPRIFCGDFFPEFFHRIFSGIFGPDFIQNFYFIFFSGMFVFLRNFFCVVLRQIGLCRSVSYSYCHVSLTQHWTLDSLLMTYLLFANTQMRGTRSNC